MTRYSPLIGVTALGCLLGLAAPASAGGAWVLWEESGDMQTFQRTPTPRPKSSYASLEECIRALDTEWQAALRTTVGPEHHGFNRLSPTSAITMTRDANTNITYIITYTCLPDSVRPPEPKGK
ncbi:MAG: hypothetical protein ACHQ8D_05145 [Candidatus Rokuibacteriota bacterium]